MQPCSFIYIWLLLWQQLSWVVATEATWPAKSEMFTIWPFTQKVCRLLFLINSLGTDEIQHQIKLHSVLLLHVPNTGQCCSVPCSLIWCLILFTARSECLLVCNRHCVVREHHPALALGSLTEPQHWDSYTGFPILILQGVQYGDRFKDTLPSGYWSSRSPKNLKLKENYAIIQINKIFWNFIGSKTLRNGTFK